MTNLYHYCWYQVSGLFSSKPFISIAKTECHSVNYLQSSPELNMPWNIRGSILNNPTDTLKCLNSNETASRLAHSITHTLSLSLFHCLSLTPILSLLLSQSFRQAGVDWFERMSFAVLMWERKKKKIKWGGGRKRQNKCLRHFCRLVVGFFFSFFFSSSWILLLWQTGRQGVFAS